MEIYFWFRKSSVSETQGTISCVVKIDGVESQPFSTKIKTEKEYWSAKEQCFIGKDSAIKEQIKENIKANLMLNYKQLLLKNNHRQLHPDEIKNEFLKSKKAVTIVKKAVTMVEAMEEYMKERKASVDSKNLSKNSYLQYKMRKSLVQRFLSELRIIDLPCKKFNQEIIDELESWMLEKQLKRSYISGIMGFIKFVQKFAKKKNLIKKLPLEYYKIQNAKKAIPVVVESNDLQIMSDFIFPKKQQEVCDAWLFCAETSLSFVDYINLRNEMLRYDDGIYWIAKARNKTDELQQIPLSERAVKLLFKYGNKLENLPKYKYHTARIHLIKITKILKKNFPDNNWERTITWHTSRRSCANVMLNDKEMGELTIASVMGWSSTNPLKRYARINKKRIAKEFFV